MKKIILILVLTIVILMGCNTPNSTSQKIGSKKIVKIGVLLPQTGPASLIGQQITKGLKDAELEINQDWKILELIYEDNKNDPKEAVRAAKKLIEIDNVDILLTSMSGSSLAVAPVAKEKNIPLIATVVYANISKAYNNTFQMYITPDSEAKALMRAISKLKTNKLGILYINTDYGLSIKNSIEQKLENTKVQIVSESYNAPETTFKTYLAKLKKSDIDTLYMTTFPHTAATMVKEIKEMGFDGKIITNALYLNGLIEKDDVYDKTYTSVPQSYLDQKFTSYPSGNIYLPFELLKIVGEEIKKGNIKNIVSILKQKDHIETATYGVIKINSNTNTTDIPLTIVLIENGKIIPIE